MIKKRIKYLTLITACTFGLMLTPFKPVYADQNNPETNSSASVSDAEKAAALNNINNGLGTLENYETLGITGVTAENLADVNFYVKTKSDNSTKLQTNVKSITDALNAINTGSTAVKNYTTLYILSVDSNNIKIIAPRIRAAREEKGSNLTRNEIINSVNTIISEISSSQSKINSGTASLSDYTLLGATKVDELNLQDINWYVKGKDNSTTTKLQTNINSILTILTNINDGKGSVSNYKNINLIIVNSDNLKAVNSCIKSSREQHEADFTINEITSETNSIISKIASSKSAITNGSATINDYNLLLIPNITEANLEDVNWYLKGKDSSTINKIKTNTDTITKALSTINQGNGILANYKTLNITAVTSNNLTPVNSIIKNARAQKGSDLTRTEIDAAIGSQLSSIPQALTKINKGLGTVADYHLFSLTNVTEANLEDVNWYLKGKNSTTSTLKTNINKVVNALNNINNGIATLTNYKTLDISCVNSINLTLVKSAVLERKSEKGSNLTKNEINSLALDVASIVDSSLSRIKLGQAELDDYSLLKITKVTCFNLEDANWYLKGKDASTINKIQSNVNTIITALSNINKGKGTVANYNTLGITNITTSKLSRAKSAIFAAETQKGSNLTRTEIINAVSNL